MLEIPAIVTTAWTVLQPFLPIIAAKGAEEIGKRAVNEVWDLIKKKFKGKPAAKDALDDLLKNPGDSDLQAAFRVQLKKLLEQDADFAASLSKLLESAGDRYSAHLEGDGAIAQGDHAVAVGKGGVHVGGNVTGSDIITGNNNTIRSKKGRK